jgi:hypothetical protein
MSQNAIIGVLVAVIAVGGGAWYYQSYVADSGDDSNKATNSRTADKKAEDEKSEGGLLGGFFEGKSLSDIMSGSDAAKCKFSGVDPETNEPMSGIMYTDGVNARIEADTVIEGTEAKVNIIAGEQVFYMWSDDPDVMPPFKIDTSMFPPGEEAPESPIDWLKDPESGVEYDCDRWSPRASTFEPPEDIEFIDMFGQMFGAMGSMFGNMMEEGVGGSMDDSGSDAPVEEWSYSRKTRRDETTKAAWRLLSFLVTPGGTLVYV